MSLRELEQNIVKVIADSKMSVDEVYYVMKNLMQEINQQYYLYCELEENKKNEEKETE